MMLSKYLFRPGKAARHRKDKCDFKDPENSIGNKIGYLKNGRYTVWKAIGPARDLFERLSPEIKAFLERGSNPVSETVIWSIYMIGRTTESAAPKVMFCSADASARREIRATIKDSGIMDKYPGIGLGDMPEPPDQQNPVPLAVQDVELPMDSEAGSIVLGAPSTTSVGKRLFVRNSNGHSLRPATAGPIIYWNGKSYYLTAAHPFNECSSIIARNSRPSFSSECDFDGQSDTDGDDDNSDDDDNIQEITSRGSLTPEDLRSRYQSSSNGESDTLSQDGFSSDEESGILTWTEETMDAANLPVYSPDLAGTNESLASYAQTQQSAQTSISVLSTLGLTGRLALSSETGANSSLDYALVEIAESDTQKANEVYCALEATSPRLKIANFRKIGPTDVDILTVTASEGLLSGRLSATASYMRLPNTRTFQEVYTIQLDGTVSDGDCGSAVFDKLSGDLYGHIVAGSPGTGMAYIIPATQVFEDLARRLGDGLTLVPPEELPSNIITLAPIESGTHKLSQCYTLSTSTSSSSMSRSPYLLKMQAEPAAQVPSPISPSPISDIQDHSLILKNKVLENKTLNLQHAKLDSQGQQYGPCYCRRRHCGDYGHCKDLWFCEDLWFCGDYGHCEGCEDWWSCWHCGHHRERRLWGSRGEEEEYALPDLEGHPRIREEGSRIPPSKGYGNADGDRSELERDHPGSADHDGEGNRNDDGGDGQRSRGTYDADQRDREESEGVRAGSLLAEEQAPDNSGF